MAVSAHVEDVSGWRSNVKFSGVQLTIHGRIRESRDFLAAVASGRHGVGGRVSRVRISVVWNGSFCGGVRGFYRIFAEFIGKVR
jgi:hypothetical protein